MKTWNKQEADTDYVQQGQSSSMMNALEGSQDGSEYSHDECHDESHEDRQQVASPHRRIDSSQESAISKHSKVTSEHNDVEEDEELQETGEDEREAAISTRLGWTVKDLEQGLTAMKQAIPFFPVLKAEKHDPESSADVIEAFEAHYGEICASVRCLLEKDINHVLGEIVSVLNKLDHATMQKRLESACAQLFTTRLPSFRELLSLSVLNKIDPNSGCFGKAFKANLERKLLDLVLTLAPEVYRDQLQYLLQTPIQSTINYMYKHNIALSFVKKPLPGFAIRRRLFGQVLYLFCFLKAWTYPVIVDRVTSRSFLVKPLSRREAVSWSSSGRFLCRTQPKQYVNQASFISTWLRIRTAKLYRSWMLALVPMSMWKMPKVSFSACATHGLELNGCPCTSSSCCCISPRSALKAYPWVRTTKRS